MSDRVVEFLARPEFWGVVAALVGFVALCWVIRQAPPGQPPCDEPPGAPGAASRDRVVVLAVVGFLLIAFGGVLAVAVGVPASLPAFAGGIGLVQWVLRTYRQRRHTSPTARRLVAFSSTALTASLLAGILIATDVLAFRFGGRPIDLTHDQAFSLSDLTVTQLRTLDRPVRLTVFFGNSERSVRQLDRVQQLADLMHAVNPQQLTVEYLDPYADVREFEELARRVPDVAVSSGDGVVVTYGDTPDAPRLVLGIRELFDRGAAPPPGSGVDRLTSTFRGEDAITSALMRLREGRRARVAFTVGHGEAPSGEMSFDRPGYGRWRSRLASVGSDVVDHNLQDAEVPADVSLLVIAGPRQAFQAVEVERIKQYLARGGPLIVLLDTAEVAGLDEILRIYNVRVNPGRIVDPKDCYEGVATIPYLPITPSLLHPITAPLIGQRALVRDASPLTILGPSAVAAARTRAAALSKAAGAAAPRATGAGAEVGALPTANPGIIAVPILRSGPDSWAESDPGSREVQFDVKGEDRGPIVAGVAATTRPALATEAPVPRLVVFAAPGLAENHWLQIEGSNLDLLMNSVSWLRGQPERIGIAPKTHEAVLFARAADIGFRRRLVLVPTLAAVIVILGLGMATYYARRD